MRDMKPLGPDGMLMTSSSKATAAECASAVDGEASFIYSRQSGECSYYPSEIRETQPNAFVDYYVIRCSNPIGTPGGGGYLDSEWVRMYDLQNQIGRGVFLHRAGNSNYLASLAKTFEKGYIMSQLRQTKY
jgi:hypothetical protein